MKTLSTLEEIRDYRYKHTEYQLIIDTNILLLFLIGIYDQNYLKNCSLLKENGKNYNINHFNLLKNILDIFLNKLTVTPHIISEINMLAQKTVDKGRKIAYIESIIKTLKKCDECHIEFNKIAQNNDVVEFGFADISLIESAHQSNYILLTDERDLYFKFYESIPIIYFSSIITTDLYKIQPVLSK